MFRLTAIVALALVGPICAGDLLPGVKKIVVLGDSITHAGQYVSIFETQLLLKEPKRTFEVLNLGLPSETVSGLSEAGHAGGKFPRPDLHERLRRVLDKTRPDLIVVCYGMNDGIYLPLDDSRFQKYKDGLKRVVEEAGPNGPKIAFATPAVFDAAPIKGRVVPADKADANHPFQGYGEVLDSYSDWLLGQKKAGWTVIDLHGPMKSALAEQRTKNPGFAFSRDGVHPNFDGHIVMGIALSRGLGLAVDGEATAKELKDATTKTSQLYKLVHQRSAVLRDGWLTDTGHKRPLGPGLPLENARTKAADLSKQIEKLTTP